MSRKDTLIIGCGGCGNNQLNDFLNVSSKYSGLFFNTNMREMESLDNFDKERRCFYIPNADGTGKNRGLTEQYLKAEISKFGDILEGFAGQQYTLMLSSANGGTGSKAVVMLPTIIEKMTDMKSVNLIVTMPSKSESDIDFENAIDFWNEALVEYKKGRITTLTLVNNNKGKSEAEINEALVLAYDSIYDLVDGKIDSSDLARYFTTRGYSFALRLPAGMDSIEEALKKGIKESPFYVPERLDCDVMIANVNINDYSSAELKELINSDSFVKINEIEEGDTFIALAGCEMPKKPIESVEASLRDIVERRRSRRRVDVDDLIVDRVEASIKKKPAPKKKKITSKDLEMIRDGSLWD